MKNVYLDFGLGDGWEDITTYLVGRYPVTRTRAIHNGLRPVIGQATFTINRSTTLANRILASETDIECKILDGATAWFRGRIRNTIKVSVGAVRVDGIKIQAVDAWMRLEKKKVRTAYNWTGYKVCNPSSTSASILHQLFVLAGFTLAELSLTSVAAVIDWYAIESDSEKTIRERIEQLLEEFGYSAYVDASGIVRMYDLAPASVTPTATLSDGAGGGLVAPYEITRNEERYKGVEVTYYPHETQTGVVVFNDSTNGTSSIPCSIPLLAGEYYPTGAASGTSIRADYKIDDYEIVGVSSPALDWEKAGDVALQDSTADGNGMLLRFYSATGGSIIKLKITGNAIVKGDKSKVTKEYETATTEIEKIELDYATTQAQAEKVSILRASWNEYSDFTYALTTTNLGLSIGQYIQIDEDAILGVDATLRIVQITDGSSPDTASLICEGVAAYTYEALTVVRETGSDDPVIPPQILPARNLLDTTKWVIGSTGSQPGFTRKSVGSVEENSIVMGLNPYGNMTPVWKCESSVPSTANNDGGWETSDIAIDHRKTYRFSVWLKRMSTSDGYSYFGLDAQDDAGVGRIQKLDGTATGVYAYFMNAARTTTADKWYFVVGYVHGSGTTVTATTGGVYDPVTGRKVAITTIDYKFTTAATTLMSRAYQWSCAVDGTIQYFYDPRIELCDGSEMQIDAILNGASSTNRLAEMADDTKITEQEKQMYAPQWAGIINDSAMTSAVPTGGTATVADGSFKKIRDLAYPVGYWTPTTAGTKSKAYYDAVEALRAYLFVTPGVILASTWTTTITIVKATWLGLWNAVRATEADYAAQVDREWAASYTRDYSDDYAGKYLGRYDHVHPDSNPHDWWLVYDTDDSPITRGVYFDDGVIGTPDPVRITTSSDATYQGKMVAALADIAWAEKNGYGTASSYGFSVFFESFGAVNAFIQNIFCSSISLSVTSGTNIVRGLLTVTSPSLTTSYAKISNMFAFPTNGGIGRDGIVCPFSGTVKTKLQWINFSAGTTNAKIVRTKASDGTTVDATERGLIGSGTSSLYTEDITVAEGDTLALHMKHSAGGVYVSVSEFSVNIAENPGILRFLEI